jgi:small neutral amino acid transporter SnatA (MarC family)
MGIINFFIALPEIFASLVLGTVMSTLLGNNRSATVVAGGVSLLFAAALMQRVQDPGDPATSRASPH